MTPRRRLRPDEARLWAMVAATVTAAPARAALEPACEPSADPPAPIAVDAAARISPPALELRQRASAEALASLIASGLASRASSPRSSAAATPDGVKPIEPNRRRRIARDREPIGARLDLHGHDQDAARAALHAFIARAHHDGLRAVLVITGQGRTGGGVLRLRTPEWLIEPPSRARVAGVSIAETRHGGGGALYVALKRRE